MQKEQGKTPMRSRIVAMAAAAAVAASMGAAPAAFAEDNEPSAGTQTGTGQTELNMILKDVSEHGGYADDDGNPDANSDDLGDNLAFKVPTSINFVVDSDGTLTGPAATAAYIENHGTVKAYVSSMDVDAESGWNFVADASASTADNSVDLQIGPAADMLQASDYLTKAEVGDATKWQMASHNDGTTDQVQLATEGDVSHLTADITSSQQFGTIHWYVTPGTAQAPAGE